MNVTIAASAFCNWQLASPLLQHIGGQSQAAVIDLAQEADFLQIAEYLTQADNRALLIYSPLELALEQAARLDIEPSQAVALWQLNAKLLVRFCKQQRGKLLLFNLSDILAAPQLCTTLCAQLWPDAAINTAPLAAISHSTPTLYRLLAQSLLSNTPELLTLSQQLAALAQPISASAAPSVTLSEINQLMADHNTSMLAITHLAEITPQYKQLTEQLQHAQTAREAEQATVLQLTDNKAELEQENQLLLEQLHVVQETLETKLVEHSAHLATIKQQLATQSTALSKEQTTVRQQTVELTKEKAAAKLTTAAVNELQQENTLLLEQLQLAQETLKTKLVEHNAHLATIKQQLAAQSTALSKEQTTVRQQTAELTKEKTATKLAATATNELQQENTLLLEQLQLVQETLETKLVEHSAYVATLKQKLATQSTALSKEQTTVRQQITELTKDKAAAKLATAAASQLQEENALLLEQLHLVQEELEQHFLAQPRQQQLPTETQAELVPNLEPPASRVTVVKSSSLKYQLNKRAVKKRLKRHVAEIANSSLFDGNWYLNQYADVAANADFSNNPALHYLKFGGFEGRNPSAHFDSQAYLDANIDVAAAGTNPLFHYLRFGEAEQRPLY